MVDYVKLESDHLRRVGNVLLSNRDEDEKEDFIAALERFRDADIAAAERIERTEAERKRIGTLPERVAQAEADAKAFTDVLAILGIIGVFGTIALGFVAAFVP